MEVKDVDLKGLRTPLEQKLSRIGDWLQFPFDQCTYRFDDFPDLQTTPEKPYSARTVVPLLRRGNHLADMYVLVMARGDGTGDANTYKPGALVVPEEYQHTEKPERVFPRSKGNTVCEAVFALFSVTPSGFVHNAMALDELGVKDGKIARLRRLGHQDYMYSRILAGEFSAPIDQRLTVYNCDDGRFGDPHAIYFNRSTPDALQVVGFLATNDENSSLIKPLSFKDKLEEKYRKMFDW